MSRLSDVVRRKFVDYFARHGHQFIKSSSVVPTDGTSLSFVNAGMYQFKPLFLADQEHYSPSRVCNYQKCIRLGGKMCDLSNIGRDLTHHTFFEMLGNWSFNDYGKHQACEWALDFLVNHLELDQDKLRITYFVDDLEQDDETRDIWVKLGIDPYKVIPNDVGDNFWEMGTSGPCGRSTEIFYPVGDDLVEIWNLVFIDRQRLPDSQIVPLKSKFVDTGMGLERILSVLCGTNSNYNTDLFEPMFRVIEAKSNVKHYGGSLTDELDINYRILVDHCRMITVSLADGIKPGRGGHSSWVRSLIKRATLISRDVFRQETPRYLLFDLVDETIKILGQAYPELPDSVKNSRRTIAKETKKFLNHLEYTEKNPTNQ